MEAYNTKWGIDNLEAQRDVLPDSNLIRTLEFFRRKGKGTGLDLAFVKCFYFKRFGTILNKLV